jgi:hypothetical protein
MVPAGADAGLTTTLLTTGASTVVIVPVNGVATPEALVTVPVIFNVAMPGALLLN